MTVTGKTRLLILSWLGILLLVGCHRETERDRVGKVIAAVREAAGKKDVREILSRLSKTYRDSQGYDYEGIRGLLFLYFRTHQKVSVLLTGLEVTVRGSSASARFQAILSGRTESDATIVPEALGAYRFDVLLSKESGDWKILSATWEPFPDGSREAPH